MKIIDINGKEREVLSIERISHSHKDYKGNDVIADYAQIVIKGRVRTWMEWYPWVEFLESNPGVSA